MRGDVMCAFLFKTSLGTGSEFICQNFEWVVGHDVLSNKPHCRKVKVDQTIITDAVCMNVNSGLLA